MSEWAQAKSKSMAKRLVACSPALKRGLVWCRVCHKMTSFNPVDALVTSFPKCCGATMTVTSPEEDQERAR